MIDLDWLAIQKWPWSPQWFRQWQSKRNLAYLERTVLPAMMAAQEAGVGIEEGWADANTAPSEILEWYAERIAGQRPLAPHCNQFRILMAHCTAEEWQQGQEQGNVHLQRERFLAQWDGHRNAWWWEGHDTISAAIPEHHNGIYLGINALNAAFMTALLDRKH